MADTSQLEAELLAALGMSEPALGNPPPTENTSQTPPPQPPAPEAPSEPVPTPPPPAVSAPTLSPTPLVPPISAEPLASASTPTPAAPVPNATPPPPASNVSAPVTLPASESITNGLNSSDLQLSQSLAEALSAAPAPADASLQHAPVATPAPQETLGSRSPKRPRSADGPDEGSTKRQKTEQTMLKQDITLGGPSLDLAAMLNNALASFDQHTIPGDNDLIMPDADMAPPAAAASPSPELEKAENKIMKASSNPFYVMRSMSLPVLGNIAVQILLRLSQQPLAETQTLLSDSDSEFCKAYDMLRDIFRATRRAFSDSPLLSPDDLDITDSEDRETIRMSNLGATAASVFGAHDVSLHDVHDAFFSIFIPEDGEYRASLTDLLVSLKTRLLLDALNKPEQSQPVSQLLDSLFPVNFDEALRQRSGDLLLNTDEEALVSKIRERREQLVKSAADESIKKSLEEQSSSAKFAESLSTFLQSHLGVVVDYAEKYGVNIPLNEEETATALDLNNPQQEEHDSLAALLQSATSHLAHTEGSTGGDTGHGKDALSNGILPEQLGSDDDSLDLKKLIEESLSSHVPELKDHSADQHLSGLSDFDSKNLASLISEKLKNDLDIPTHGLANMSASAHPPNVADSNNAVHAQYLAQLNHAHAAPYQAYAQGAAPAAPVGANGELLPPNQSMPTAALYEKARQAAVAKSSNTTRREGLHSTRRPWTPEEEKALMAGLDMVKGPHWSQILSLFGQHGTISDILKDRTQVQLKDKARNLKLFFLKTNSEMPYYLQSVTGELKTRAPGQAARKEAEEKARMNLEEEQARIQGIMTLAGGMQNAHHSVPNPSLAASPSKRTSPATPVFGGAMGSATTNAPHMTASNGTNLPAMPIPPRIKTELPDQHALSKVTAFPPIQPAPAHGSTMQQARTPLPPLQPQPGQHQQPKPHTSQQYQQPQQPRPQDAQKVPMPLPQQQRQPLTQPQSPAQPQPQSQPQTHQQPQPQQHQQPQAQATPPAPSQSQPNGLPRPPSAPQASLPQQSPPQVQQQQQPRVSPPTTQSQPLPTPPIPPNHHSTPDHAQDTKLFETLQAAIAASTASESQSHIPLATVVSEGGGS